MMMAYLRYVVFTRWRSGAEFLCLFAACTVGALGNRVAPWWLVILAAGLVMGMLVSDQWWPLLLRSAKIDGRLARLALRIAAKLGSSMLFCAAAYVTCGPLLGRGALVLVSTY
jgi:hypothetical protein